MLKVSHLSKTVHNKTILNDVNFEAAHGRISIFLGGSGVGKSTIMRVLNHLEGYDTGTFTLDGVPLNLAHVNHDHTVGMVFQHFNLFDHLNVEENIILPLIKCKNLSREEAKQVSDKLLERYGLFEKAVSSTRRLSGGQKQRLAIARTLAMNPKIICLDEPTSALDPKLTAQVAKFITELTANHRIVLLATHDMNLLEQLDGDLFLMEKGSIVERTSKSNWKADPATFPRLQQFLRGA